MTQRVVLVTGGTGGIGTAICRAFADQGHRVVASWLKGVDDGPAWQAQQKNSDYNFFIAEGDVSDFDQAAAMVASAQAQAGGIDILVNCAGITRDSTLKKMNKDQWHSVISSNLDSVFNVTKHVLDGMLERNFGRIINIASINGQKGQFGQANYAAAKAGMHGFTMSLAQEVAKKGITVNTVSPGYVGTKMVMAVPEDIRNKIIAQIPVGRLATPEEIAHAITFLAAENSGFITGMNLAINGGQHMH
jgi:acetoacetyl-CoA reductase